jgi:hypothetical protein
MKDYDRVKHQGDSPGVRNAVVVPVPGNHDIAFFDRNIGAVVVYRAVPFKKNKIFGFLVMLVASYGRSGRQGQLREELEMPLLCFIHKMAERNYPFAVSRFFPILDIPLILVNKHTMPPLFIIGKTMMNEKSRIAFSTFLKYTETLV